MHFYHHLSLLIPSDSLVFSPYLYQLKQSSNFHPLITLNHTNHKKNGNRKPCSKNKISAYSAPISRLKDDRLRKILPPPFRGRSLFGRRSEFPVSGRSSVGTRLYTLTFMMHCALAHSIRERSGIDFQLRATSELFYFVQEDEPPIENFT